MKAQTATQLYRTLYKYLDAVTPLKTDCGALCGAACCIGEDSGMLLYPGEERLFSAEQGWAEISTSAFLYDKGRAAVFLSCHGKCPRGERPLACRMFPLVPYKRPRGAVEIVLDARGMHMCPLIRDGRPQLQRGFVRRVKNVARVLAQYKSPARFIEAQSELISDYISDLKRFGGL